MARYQRLVDTGELERRTAAAQEMLSRCELCPRRCRIDRRAESGYCGAPGVARVADYGPHFGEELELSGWCGSGTIFFSHCTMKCAYCQNRSISSGEGESVSAAELADIMLSLQRERCHNINLVSPTPYIPAMLEALGMAVERGLTVPVVFNCGGYESVPTLRLLEGIVDIYLPDIKYADDEVAVRLSDAPEYWETSTAAVREMHRQVGELAVNEEGIATSGLIIRHLVLPGGLSGADRVARFVADELSRDTYVNLMGQYRPQPGCAERPLLRRLTRGEFDEALHLARRAGLRRIRT